MSTLSSREMRGMLHVEIDDHERARRADLQRIEELNAKETLTIEERIERIERGLRLRGILKNGAA